jgi:hypothetical protein
MGKKVPNKIYFLIMYEIIEVSVTKKPPGHGGFFFNGG